MKNTIKLSKLLVFVLVGLLVFASLLCFTNKSKSAVFATTTSAMAKIETDNVDWSWTGFNAVENENASRMWQHATYNKDATGVVTYYGSTLEVVGFVGKEGGSIEVDVDGVKKQGSLYAETDEYKKSIVTFADLQMGWHTVTITSLEQDKWHAIDYININMLNEDYAKQSNLALIGDIICSVPNPTGGGNKDLNVIRNEKIYPQSNMMGLGPAQYDSYIPNTPDGDFYMGYEFGVSQSFQKIIFQEGCHWTDGGWFANGVKVQVRVNDVWTDVTLTNNPNYPVSDLKADHGSDCEIYIFEFEKIQGDAIRLVGLAGGTGNFVSVSQIAVYADVNATTLLEDGYYKKSIEYSMSNPTTPDDSSNSSSSSTTSSDLSSSSVSNSTSSATSATQSKKKGCKSSINASTYVSFVALGVVAMAMTLKRKKD